ncbi:hypothetical protein Tco_0631031 [Tanacetum coccineum]
MVVWIFKARMLAMQGMETGMQGGKTGIKQLMEQILFTTKDKVGVHLDEEENDFMLDNAYGNNTLEELNAVVIMMTRIQPTNDKFDAKPTYVAEFISEVNALQVDMINGLLSKRNHEQHHHEKLETIIHTFADDQIDSDIIFDDPYMDNNSGQAEHDTNAHAQSLYDFESLIINVQERIKEFKINPEQASDYKEAYEELQNELNVEKDQLLNEKEEICEEILKTQDETLKIKRETDLYKKAFKERENKYLEDIVSLEEKLRSHDRIVYKMSHSLQTIHMLGNKPNKVYDPYLKTGLVYENPERLKKAMEAQPKMYDGEKLESTQLKVDLPDYEETREDAKQSRLKMKDKMIQLDYAKLNALYESFVPQTEIPVQQTYFSSPSTYNVSFESNSKMSNLPSKKCLMRVNC